MRRLLEDLNWIFIGWVCAAVALAAAICGELLAFVVAVAAMNGCWVLRLWLDDRFYKAKRREADKRRQSWMNDE